MSKGLGTLQRKLIEISTATQTIWEAAPNGITVEVADTSEKTARGVTTTAKHGFTWRKTGEPYYSAQATVHNPAEMMELKAEFRSVSSVYHKPDDSVLSACWSMHHIRATLWPELWKHGDNRENLPHPNHNYYTFPQIPADIKKKRNSAQASLSRAVKSLENRGMLAYAGMTHSEAANAIWKTHGGHGRDVSKFHKLSYILHPDLTTYRDAI